MKAGDIVEIQPHVDLDVTRILFDKPTIGIIKSTLSGHGYCDVLLTNGRVIFVADRVIKVVDESR